MTPLSAHHTTTSPTTTSPPATRPAFRKEPATPPPAVCGGPTVPATRPLLEIVPADLVLLQFGRTPGQPPVRAVDRFESDLFEGNRRGSLGPASDGRLALPSNPSNSNGKGFDDVLSSIMAGFRCARAHATALALRHAGRTVSTLNSPDCAPPPPPCVIPPYTDTAIPRRRTPGFAHQDSPYSSQGLDYPRSPNPPWSRSCIAPSLGKYKNGSDNIHSPLQTPPEDLLLSLGQRLLIRSRRPALRSAYPLFSVCVSLSRPAMPP